MTICDHHIQNVIQAYGRQLNRSCSLTKTKGNKQVEQSDHVSISAEAKKKQIVSKTAADVIDRIARHQDKGEFEQVILRKLSQEYGRPLDVQGNEEGGNIVFKVVDESDGEVVRRIDSNDCECLQKRLFEITELSVQETT